MLRYRGWKLSVLIFSCALLCTGCGDGEHHTSDGGLACPEPTEGPTTHDQDVSSNEVWTATGSPHRVDRSISIEAELTIEPCSVVELAPGVSLTVSEGGRLLAEGEETRPIQFTGQQSEPWGNLHVEAPGTASLAYVSFEGGGPDEITYGGATLVVSDSGERPGARPLRAEQVRVSGSGGLGILCRGLAGFDPESSDLTVTGSGSEMTEHPYPVLISAEAAGSVPSGTYTGNAMDAIAVDGQDEVQIDTTWTDRGVPYRLLSSVFVNGGGNLTVGEGVEMALDPGVSIKVDGAGEGSLSLIGAASSPVILRRAEPDIAWGALWVDEGSTMILRYVDLEGGGADYGCTIVADGASELPLDPMIEVESVTLTGSVGYGMCLYGGASFSPGSAELVITGSGADSADERHPLLIGAPAILSIPDGDYTGNARDAILVDEYLGIATDLEVETRGVPYDIGVRGDSLIVDGATLTLQAGVVLRFEGDGLNVETSGRLVVMGTAEEPVVLTSSAETPAAGDWIGVYLWGPWDAEHVVQHAQIEYAGADSSCIGYSCHSDDAALMILSNEDGWMPDSAFVADSLIRHSAAHGIDRGWTSDAAPLDFTVSNTFQDVAGCAQTTPMSESQDCPVNPPCE
ncbi:MAG: hypothetical protein JXR96_26745 [Deltaproteobacteria bacterium]|nr:hypothetical protein [Deltaproteobacteria bacterium]